MATELVLDSNIRMWVFLPIFIASFLVGIVRHYISVIFASESVVGQQVEDQHTLNRIHSLRECGKYIPLQSFNMRRVFFIVEEGENLKAKKPPAAAQNLLTDKTLMANMLKGNVISVLPMILIGGWINFTFSGFVTSKVPFPLTLRFKPMLQRGIELSSLDASWVSSASWYFLTAFGLRDIHSLIFNEDNESIISAVPVPTGTSSVFVQELEALQIYQHNWALTNVESLLYCNNIVL